MNNSDENNQPIPVPTPPAPVPTPPAHDPWVMPVNLAETQQATQAAVPLYDTIITPPAEPVIAKKGRKGLIATIVILTLLLLAAIGYIVYTDFLYPKKEVVTATAPATTEQKSEVVSPNAQAVVDKVRTAINDNLAKTYPTMTITDTTTAPVYKADGTAYAVGSSSLGHSLSIVPDSNALAFDGTSATKVGKAVANSFTAQTGFTTTSQDWLTTYQNSTVICTATVSSSPVNVNCADKNAYSDLITTIKPFATAYLASSDGKTNGDGVLFTDPKITQKTSGYSTATISMGNTNSPVGGGVGLFYAKDANWTYWKETQGVIACTDYNTHDIQQAFVGDVCFDAKSNTNSTVKVTL